MEILDDIETFFSENGIENYRSFGTYDDKEIALLINNDELVIFYLSDGSRHEMTMNEFLMEFYIEDDING